MPTIGVAIFGRFRANVERGAHFLGTHQVHGPLAKLVVGGRGTAAIKRAAGIVELFDQRTAAIEPIERQAFSKSKPLDLEVQFLVGAIAKVRVVLLAAPLNRRGQWIVSTSQP